MNHGRFKFEKLVKYPHMKPHDIAVWQRFIEKYPTTFESVDYDVCVGEGADFLPTGEDTPDGRENRLYQKKIDVVGYKDATVTLIEVKPEANMKALGQILSYYEMYFEEHKDVGTLKNLIVAERMDRDMKSIFLIHMIDVVVV